jgi:hypothetical protein
MDISTSRQSGPENSVQLRASQPQLEHRNFPKELLDLYQIVVGAVLYG